MSHDDHHDDKIPEYKEIIPFALIVCALFAYVSTLVGQSGLARKASAELEHHTGFEQVTIAFKGKKAILSGNVANAAQKEEAAELVAAVGGVTGIKSNLIEIGLEPVNEEHIEVAKAHDSHAERHHTPTGNKKKSANDEALPTSPEKKVHNEIPATAHKTVPTPIAESANPFIAVLRTDSTRELEIIAHVSGPSADLDAIEAATKKLDELKREITANGDIDSWRVSTVLTADFSLEHEDQITEISYIVE